MICLFLLYFLSTIPLFCFGLKTIATWLETCSRTPVIKNKKIRHHFFEDSQENRPKTEENISLLKEADAASGSSSSPFCLELRALARVGFILVQLYAFHRGNHDRRPLHTPLGAWKFQKYQMHDHICRSDFSPTAGLGATGIVGLKSDLHILENGIFVFFNPITINNQSIISMIQSTRTTRQKTRQPARQRRDWLKGRPGPRRQAIKNSTFRIPMSPSGSFAQPLQINRS